MSSRERTLLKKLVQRIRTDADFARSVASDPAALTRVALSAAQKAAVVSLAVAAATSTKLDPDIALMFWS